MPLWMEVIYTPIVTVSIWGIQGGLLAGCELGMKGKTGGERDIVGDFLTPWSNILVYS